MRRELCSRRFLQMQMTFWMVVDTRWTVKATILLTIFGNVSATDDVVIAGETVIVRGSATIDAGGSVLIAGGTDVSVSESGSRRLTVNSDSGEVVNLGSIMAPNIESSTGGSLYKSAGRIDAGDGKIFIEVGEWDGDHQ